MGFKNKRKLILFRLPTFSFKNLGKNSHRQKVGHSDLVMIQDTAPWLDVLPHQVWWSCIK